jgi:hypothetical protein
VTPLLPDENDQRKNRFWGMPWAVAIRNGMLALEATLFTLNARPQNKRPIQGKVGNEKIYEGLYNGPGQSHLPSGDKYRKQVV